MTAEQTRIRSLEVIDRVLEEPTPKAIDVLLKSRHVFWVDLHGGDDEIVFDCERCLRTGALTAEERDADGLYIRYGTRGADVPLSHSAADRHITIHTLNGVLSPDYEIRFCIDSNGGDTLAFLVLGKDDWQALEARHGPAVGQRFYQIAAKPNLFTDVLGLPNPPVVRPARPPKKLQDAWRALAKEADALTPIMPRDDVPCEEATAYVLTQLQLGGIDLERVREAVVGAPIEDQDLVRTVVACCDGNPVKLARTADPAMLLHALTFLAPAAGAKRFVTKEVVLAAVQALVTERQLVDVRELDALDQALGVTLTRDAFLAIEPTFRETLTGLVNRFYELLPEHDPRRWDRARWAPRSIEFVGDSASLSLLRRFTSRFMEGDPCASNRAKASLTAALYNERVRRLSAAGHADSAATPTAEPPRPQRPTHARHRKFGIGEIVRFVEGDKVAVRFGAETKILLGSALEFIFPERST